MQLTMKNRQDIENPAVTIEYRELTENVKRVCDFVRGIDKTILCKKGDSPTLFLQVISIT